MATPDIFMPGTPDGRFAKVMNSPKLNPSHKETQESLKRSFEKYLATDGSPAFGKLFIPEKHLAYEEPSYIHTMEDIGFLATSGVSPVAVSEPFHLFSQEAVDTMRAEIFSPEVQENYSYSSDISGKQLRGYAPK